METLYRLSYWGLLLCGNEIKHTPNEGVLKTNLTCHPLLATSRLSGRLAPACLKPAGGTGWRAAPDTVLTYHAIDPDDPERRKAPCHKGTGLSRNNCSAASYSPTGSPLQ
ncbi:hypothetical protein ACFRH6_31635, partial [Streptomyces sp. NPDC056749]|uniref:hypothetical protein n=1 Tax=Streptomyces sp. NPDC056749 TaxID=3345936 RepID=UPI00367C3493